MGLTEALAVVAAVLLPPNLYEVLPEPDEVLAVIDGVGYTVLDEGIVPYIPPA